MRLPEGAVSAAFFDGETAARHQVTVTIDRQTPPALIIDGDADALPQRWLLQRLRALSDQADDATLIVTTVADSNDETPRDPARLVIEDAALRDWIRISRPDLHRRDLRSGTGRRILARGIAALAAFLVILFVLLPQLANTLATIIPEERAAQFGRATVRQMELIFGDGDSLRCENPEAQAIWNDLAERFIDRSAYDAPVTVIVLDVGMVNAFAVPGGHVVFFRGLVDAAESPDEVAAVMAHEIGHVVARDPMRLALRSVGSVGILGLVLGDFAGGGLVLALTEQLLNSSYSRGAEEDADTYAIARMIEQNIDPAALARFFQRLREDYGDIEGIGEHFVSHPSLGTRIEVARAAGEALNGTASALSAADWSVLQRSCDD